jgi:hypothetical protein
MTENEYKVLGSGREWFVWIWRPGSWFWKILLGPYLTKRRARKEMEKLQ